MVGYPPPIQGRGTGTDSPNRFETLIRISDPDDSDGETPSPSTQFLSDASRSIITSNESPDVPFASSLNPYRGCEHGCAYCYARPTHEYLGFSAGLDFETKILVKEKAPELLHKELSSSKWRPQVLALSGVTDPYQPVERDLRITRRCLEILLEFRNPVVVITKNALVIRDVDLLVGLAENNAVAVFLSITTLDSKLCGILEPRASRPSRRLEAVSALSQAGVPTGVMVAPVIPGLTDMEIPAIVEASVRAGARFAGTVPLRLPHAVAPLFEMWLGQHLPGKQRKILNRIRAIRGGKLNDPRFGSRMQGEGVFAEQMAALFRVACRKTGIEGMGPTLSTDHFRKPTGSQMMLFKD